MVVLFLTSSVGVWRKNVFTELRLWKFSMVPIFLVYFAFGSGVEKKQYCVMKLFHFQFIYPFVSEVSCDYKLNAQRRLANAACHQMQYFLPSAYKGDVLATVMTNIR